MKRNLQHAGQARVFLIPDRAGPNHAPQYQLLARPTSVSWGQGDITPVRVPDPEQYGKFITIDKIKGTADLPGLSLEVRMTRDLSEFLKMARNGCPVDLHIHVGACKDPSDFDRGWEKAMVLEAAEITNYGTGDLGAFEDDAVVMETLDFVGQDYYELKDIAFAQYAESQAVQEIVGVAICDSRSCGDCGLASDGCQKVFAITVSAGGSPGLPGELVFTLDGGETFDESSVTTLPANRNASSIACVGPYLVIVSNTDDAIHYALLSDLVNGVESWTRMATGFVGAGSPTKIFSLGRTATWIAGDGGYVYFSDDPTAEFVTQTAGDIVAGNLGAIHGIDEDNLLVGGASNALLVTTNGGSTWSQVTGPSGQAAVTVKAVQMLSEKEWIAGYADGKVFYTINGGVSWTQKTLPGQSSIAQIDAIEFATRTVGYMAVRTATPAARLLRTIDGGYSWYVLPENVGSIPATDYFNSLAVCGEDPNLVWGGGLADDALDGILVKGA